MYPISDMLIRIKNAQKAGHESVSVSYSKLKHEILKLLEKRKMVDAVDKRGKKVRKTLDVKLLYRDDSPLIKEVKFFSKPSRRFYVSYKDLKRSSHGGVVILTTPKGVLDYEEARKNKVGGELIAEVW